MAVPQPRSGGFSRKELAWLAVLVTVMVAITWLAAFEGFDRLFPSAPAGADGGR